jgi:hypothetical protein
MSCYLNSIPDPDLSDDFDQESSATWIELFGDVFYVGWLRQVWFLLCLNQ